MVAAENGDNFAFLSCAVRDDEDPSHLGLITGHAYSILKLVQSKDGQKFVQVLNHQKVRFQLGITGWSLCMWANLILIDPLKVEGHCDTTVAPVGV
jgi:hypothetical protein